MFNYINSTGIIVPDTEQVLSIVEGEYQDTTVFGDSLSVAPNTPQGMFIATDTASRISTLQISAATANQINPNFSSGIFLDAICALTGLQRLRATHSTASITLSGVPNTVIPIGTEIQSDITLETWSIINPTALDEVGNGVATFKATNTGPIAAPANTLTQIISAPAGLETVNNETPAVLGINVQSDQALRLYRNSTLFLQGSSLAGAMISGVSTVLGVNPYPTFIENIKNTAETIDGVEMSPHSIYMCIAGGDDLEVATMMYNRKPGGVAYVNGASSNNVSQEVEDPVSGQIQTVLFDRPDLLPFLVQVYVNNNPNITNITQIVQQSILDYVNGLQEGNHGLVVGQSVSSFTLAAAVNINYPSLSVTSVLITLASVVDFQPDEILIEKWQRAIIQQSSIAVIIT